jgi:hypothetical protein
LLFAARKHAQLNGYQMDLSSWGTQANDGRVPLHYAAKAMLARVWLYYTGYHNKTSLPNGTNKQQIANRFARTYMPVAMVWLIEYNTNCGLQPVRNAMLSADPN